MANCRSCNAPILWIRTPGGKLTPLDAKPEKRYVLNLTHGGDVPGASLEPTYVSHFATCPNAAKHRKPRP